MLAFSEVSIWMMKLLIRASHHFPNLVPAWVYTPSFAEVLVPVVFLLAFFFFARFRDRFLRRDHLKVRIADYGNDWIELSSSDAQYFAELAKLSEVYSE